MVDDLFSNDVDESYRPTCKHCGVGEEGLIMMGEFYECSACEETVCSIHAEHCHGRGCTTPFCCECAADLECECTLAYARCGFPCKCPDCGY